MSDDTPPVDPPGDGEPAAAGRSAVAVALRRLAPPEHGKDFWSDLDRRLADEPQLRLAPRAAIRPITQPPPVTDDKKLAAGLTAKADGPPRHRPRFRIFAAALAVVVGLLVIGALSQDPAGDQTATGGDDRPGGSDAAQARGEDAGAEDDQPSTTRAPTPPPGYIDPSAPLDPAGVGPLRIGATFADLQTAGIQVQADQATFRGSGGTCYDARVPGALDLRLRFRNPDGTRRVDDPAQGVLTAISIESSLPTSRPAAGTNFVLGSSQDEVLYAYAANIDDRPNPYVSRGHVYRVDAGNGLGTAYVTDGVGVVQIAVGEMDVIRFVKDCG